MAKENAELRAALAAAQARATVAETELQQAKATASCTDAMIAHLKLEIAKLRREIYGTRSERKSRPLDQLELQLEEMETAATEDVIAAEEAAGDDTSVTVKRFQRRRGGGRKPFPEHLPRERVEIEAPSTCKCCGSSRLRELGEGEPWNAAIGPRPMANTETLEVIPRQWKVIQTVRKKFSCGDCEGITQPPAPFHAIPRGWAGPSLLAFAIGLERMATR